MDHIRALRQNLGESLSILGTIFWWLCSIAGFFLSLAIVHEVTPNFFVFAIAFVFFPLTFAVAPFYALFHWGNWIPLAINYGGLIGSAILRAVGNRLNSDYAELR